MTALAQALISIRHRPGRAFLTALGTALGIGTIVALLAVSAGATQTAGQFVHLGRSELGLFQKDAADPTTSVLPESLITRLRRQPWVTDAMGLQLLVNKVPRDPGAIVFGAKPDSFEVARMVFTSGHGLRSPNQIVIGDELAPQLHARVGQVLEVAHRHLRVVGIYHIGVSEQDSGAFIPLATAQAISGHIGEVTSIVVKLAPGTRPSTAQRLIKQRFPGLLVIGDADEALRAGANGQLIANVTRVIVVLALLIGAIGVMNTMLMSVVERRSEFALRSAVGWSGTQIASSGPHRGPGRQHHRRRDRDRDRLDRSNPAGPRARRSSVRLARRYRLGPRPGAADRNPDRRARRHLSSLASSPRLARPRTGTAVTQPPACRRRPDCRGRARPRGCDLSRARPEPHR